nr:hypothetical protein Q903MT_gene59 [Picea sitchensis]
MSPLIGPWEGELIGTSERFKLSYPQYFVCLVFGVRLFISTIRGIVISTIALDSPPVLVGIFSYPLRRLAQHQNECRTTRIEMLVSNKHVFLLSLFK